MRRLKVMTVLGTRPEIIRLSRIMAKLDTYCDHVVVHTGQNYDYELNQIFFDDLGIRPPDHYLESAGETAAQTIGNVISRMDDLIVAQRPDAMLVLGDTNSGLAVIPAKRRRVPIFHYEAGNRCFDMRVPEEINRRIIDHTADVNLTYSAIARENLLREGLPADLTFRIGSPMAEVLQYYADKIELSGVVGDQQLERGQYFCVSVHREETVDSLVNLTKLSSLLSALDARYGLPIILSTHPRTRKRLQEFGVTLPPSVRALKPLAFSDYVALQKSAKAVLSDSGTISEEASILNLRALNCRETHERHEAIEQGSVMLVGLDTDRVMQALAILEDQPSGAERRMNVAQDYVDANISDKMVRVIHSYTDYVNRVVWKKY